MRVVNESIAQRVALELHTMPISELSVTLGVQVERVFHCAVCPTALTCISCEEIADDTTRASGGKVPIDGGKGGSVPSPPRFPLSGANYVAAVTVDGSSNQGASTATIAAIAAAAIGALIVFLMLVWLLLCRSRDPKRAPRRRRDHVRAPQAERRAARPVGDEPRDGSQ